MVSLLDIVIISADHRGNNALKSLLMMIERNDIDRIDLCQNTQTADEYFKTNPPDAAIIDIDSPGVDWISYTKQLLKLSNNTAIVFISSDGRLAVDAFSLNVLDYLVTPVTSERLLLSLEKIKRHLTAAAVNKDNRNSVKVFGRLSVFAGEVPVHWNTSKSAELFVYMLFHGKKDGLDKWRIINDLWNDKNEENADVNFRSTLYRLNNTLKEYNVGKCVKTVNGAYKLECESLIVDAFVLEDFSKLRYPFEDQRLPELKEFLLTFNGDILGGYDFGWSYPFCENYRFLFNQLSKKLCRQFIDKNDFIQADSVISNFLRVDAFDEEAHDLKLKIMKHTGRHLEAEKYKKFVSELFKNELGLDIHIKPTL